MKLATAAMMGLVTGTMPLMAFGFAPQTHLDRGNALETAEGFETRHQRRVQWTTPASARTQWSAFTAAEGAQWQAMWDQDTRVPQRIFGEGIAVPGASLSPDAAVEATRATLARHLDMLAPGASMDDLVLVANDFDAQSNLRTVAFEQHHRGMAVLGGQVSVRIKNDRLFVLASEALPNVDAAPVRKTVRADKAAFAAQTWIAQDAGQVSLRTGAKEAFVLPIVAADGQVSFHTVVEVVVDAKQPIGRWSVYLDAATGAPVARRQTLMFASGTVQMNAPERRPGSTRLDYPAPDLTVQADNRTLITDANGSLTWPGEAAAAISFGPTGGEVTVDNDAGARATDQATLEPGGTYTWDNRGEELVDAQITTFIHGNVVKTYAKAIAPDMGWLTSARLQATVNINDSCNAFSDGTTINFFQSSRRCENTGRLADVVHHEFGHSFHAHAIVRGAGSFDTALSEGGSDYLAATITNDNGMGRGFFYSNAPLRDVDEARDRVWPEDSNNEPHEVGLIFGGAMWDLRKTLITTFPTYEEGVAHTDFLWYQALKRSSDIPSSYAEVLAADDDDGDVSNGTPNICAINEAFARHGLADVNAVGPPIQSPVLVGNELTVPVGEAPSDCPGVMISNMNVIWQLRDNPATQSTLALGSVEGGYQAAIPEQAPGSVVQYRVEVSLDDGSLLRLPNNPADPYYEYFVGDVVELYCTDFESDPEADGWNHELLAGEAAEGADDWQWGEPQGTSGSGDPQSAFSGNGVVGNDLGGGNFNGKYQSSKQNAMHTPRIDTQRYPVVRLQYRRWLTVEDGDFDQASILSNSQPVWTNRATGGQGDTHHEDREWRFHDVDLSNSVVNDSVQVSFTIASDQGLEFGGWTLDDFCVVGFLPPGQALCGNGMIESGESCDDGNLADDDGCQSDCSFTPGVIACGNGIVEEGEVCDDGNLADDDGCQADCSLTPAEMPMTPDCTQDPTACENPMLPEDPRTLDGDNGGCGCTAHEGDAALPSALASLLLFGLLGLRRRR